MPNFDGTGPAGEGPMTGRGGCGRGKCFAKDSKMSLEDQEKLLEAKLEQVRKAKQIS